MSGSDRQTVLQRLVPRVAAMTGLVTAIAFSWWMRVENAREPSGPPQVQMGQSIDMGRVKLTPMALTLTRGDKDGTRLILRAQVENITGETQMSVFGFPSHPPQAEGMNLQLPEPEVILDRDAELLHQLQPRIPENVSIIWQIPGNAYPRNLSLTFFRQTFKLRDNLYGQASWLGFQPAARLDAAMEESS